MQRSETDTFLAWISNDLVGSGGGSAGISSLGLPAPKAGTYKGMSQELIIFWDRYSKNSYPLSNIWDNKYCLKYGFQNFS